MRFKPGNQFWKQRTKHGKDQLFASPALLWVAACQYFDWADRHPLDSVEYNGKDAIECIVPKMRAYTQKALFLYLGVNHSYFSDFRERLNKDLKGQVVKKKELAKAFLDVIERIDDTIFVQKFEGAAAGLLKEALIIRELGLADKQQLDANIDSKVKHSGKVTVEVRSSGVPLAKSEADVEAKR